jgi:glycerophosphoryl diester phosphodiesterase
MGADYIEPDLVSTKDHQLVVRHENDITQTTGVASHPEFANRKTTNVVDGVSHTGWFTEDFTLAELRTLRAVERLPDVRRANTAFNGLFPIPTFQELIDLAKRNRVGIYPETKHPTYFDSIGLSLEEPLVAALRRNGLDKRDSKVFVQCFEVSNLRELNRRIAVPLIQLIDASGAPADYAAHGIKRTYDDLVTRAGLKRIATYADGIGPDKCASCRPTTPTACKRRPPSCARRIATACSSTRSRSARRTSSCRRTTARASRRPRSSTSPAATSRPSCVCSSASASTASSPTTPTPRSRCATSGSADMGGGLSSSRR